MKNFFNGMKKKGQENKSFTESIIRHPEGDNPKDLQIFESRFFANAQNDVTTCAPLVGEPKSLISKGGKNVLDFNQEPSPEFVSLLQLPNKFYPLTKREGSKNGNRLINL